MYIARFQGAMVFSVVVAVGAARFVGWIHLFSLVCCAVGGSVSVGAVGTAIVVWQTNNC